MRATARFRKRSYKDNICSYLQMKLNIVDYKGNFLLNKKKKIKRLQNISECFDK